MIRPMIKKHENGSNKSRLIVDKLSIILNVKNVVPVVLQQMPLEYSQREDQ